jgi:hypothetical protein
MRYQGKNQELLILENVNDKSIDSLKLPIPNALTFLWFKFSQAVKLDGSTLQPNADSSKRRNLPE